jgi:hypothetical protein
MRSIFKIGASFEAAPVFDKPVLPEDMPVSETPPENPPVEPEIAPE